MNIWIFPNAKTPVVMETLEMVQALVIRRYDIGCLECLPPEDGVTSLFDYFFDGFPLANSTRPALNLTLA